MFKFATALIAFAFGQEACDALQISASTDAMAEAEADVALGATMGMQEPIPDTTVYIFNKHYTQSRLAQWGYKPR